MKLKSLEVKDFLAHDALSLEFQMRTMITGANHVGKTSVRDAIVYALTGIARKLPKKNMALALGRDGLKPQVTLTIDPEVDDGVSPDEVAIKRTTTSCSLSAAELGDLCLNSEQLINVLADSYFFIDGMTPKERQAMVVKLLAGEKIDLVAAATKAGVLGDAQTPEMVDVIRKAQDDAEAAYKQAYAARREAGQEARAAEEIAGAANAPTKITISSGKEVDITADNNNVADVKAKLEKVTKEYHDFMQSIEGAKLVSPANDKARIAEIDKLLKENGHNVARQEAVAKRAMLVARKRDVEAHLRAMEASMSRIKTEGQDTEAAIASLDSPKCSVCGSVVECPNQGEHAKLTAAQQEKLKSLREDYRKARDQAKAKQDECDELEQSITECDTALAGGTEVDVSALTLEKKQLEEAIVGYEIFIKHECSGEDGGYLPEEQRTSYKLQKRVEDGQAILAARQRWEAGKQSAETAKAATARLKAVHNAWDKVVTFLAPEGPARALLAESASSASFPADLAEAWGCTVEISPDGDVIFNGRLVELASASERLECGIMCQAWIAEATLGWCICDEVEKLVGKDRVGFGRWFMQSGTVQVIAIASSDKPINIPGVQHIRIGE